MKGDLTNGKISRTLLTYFLPIALGTLFQQLYSAVDAIIVGKYVGKIALAAVGGSATQVSNLLIGFFVALSSGAAVIVAQMFGAQDFGNLKRALGTSLVFSLICGAILSVVGYILTPWFLEVLKTPEDTMQDAILYLRIIFLSVIGQLVYNVAAGALRAVGNSRLPFVTLLICTICNVAFDYILVVWFHLGVLGVAVATLACVMLNMVLTMGGLMIAKGPYRFTFRDLGFDRELFQRMMRIGVPAGLQGSMYSVSNMILQVAINLLGTTVTASWTLSGKVDGFFWACSSAGGVAVMNFVAQNYGAGKIDRVKESEKVSLRIFGIMTIVLSAVLAIAGPLALPLFSDEADVVQTTTHILWYIVPFYPLWTYIEMSNGILRGVGDALMPTVITGIGICLLRVVWVVLIYRMWPTLLTVCISYPTSWLLTDAALLVYRRKGNWLRVQKHE